MIVYKMDDGKPVGNPVELLDGDLVPYGWTTEHPVVIIDPEQHTLITICRVDANKIFTGESKEIDPRLPVSSGWVAIEAPPTGIQQFNGSKWLELSEYPTPPIVVPVEQDRIITKVDFVEKLISLGYASTLDGMLAQSPAEVRQAWYAYTSINLDDPRLTAFFDQAGIDLKTLFK